jgi:DNA-binding NarL/FixJ family response regulator
MPIRVAIVEDDSGFRESLAVLIGGADEFRCVGSYPNAEIALKGISREWPDVVLMDINLPQMSGIECVAKLKQLKPTLQIMMLTVYLDNEQIFNSLKAGASGYLLKKTSPAKIMDAIAEIHAGGAPMSMSIARKVVQVFQKENHADETKCLTRREYEILTHLAKGSQYKEIAEALSVSIATVRSHIQNIYDKLHVRSRTEAVVKFLSSETQLR